MYNLIQLQKHACNQSRKMLKSLMLIMQCHTTKAVENKNTLVLIQKKNQKKNKIKNKKKKKKIKKKLKIKNYKIIKL